MMHAKKRDAALLTPDQLGLVQMLAVIRYHDNRRDQRRKKKNRNKKKVQCVITKMVQMAKD